MICLIGKLILKTNFFGFHTVQLFTQISAREIGFHFNEGENVVKDLMIFKKCYSWIVTF